MKKRSVGILMLISLLTLTLLAGCGDSSDTGSDVSYPEENISVIVPYDAGGATDLLARLIADQMDSALDVSVVVENKAGGTGAVGCNYGSSAEGDGYTVTMFTTEASTAHMQGIADYSHEDFTPVSLVAVGPCSLAVPANSPFDTLEDFVDYAKENPGKLQIASMAPGGIWRIACDKFISESDIDVTVVPYDGGGTAIPAALGNQVDAVSVGFSEVLSYVKNGDLKLLAAGGSEAPAAYPEAKTFEEYGYDVSVSAYWAFGVPKDTPQEIVDALEKILDKAINNDEVDQFLLERGFSKNYLVKDEFVKWLEETDAVFKEVIG